MLFINQAEDRFQVFSKLITSLIQVYSKFTTSFCNPHDYCTLLTYLVLCAILKKSPTLGRYCISNFFGGKNIENFVAEHSLRVRKEPGLGGLSVALRRRNRFVRLLHCGLGTAVNTVSQGRQTGSPALVLPVQAAGGQDQPQPVLRDSPGPG